MFIWGLELENDYPHNNNCRLLPDRNTQDRFDSRDRQSPIDGRLCSDEAEMPEAALCKRTSPYGSPSNLSKT